MRAPARPRTEATAPRTAQGPLPSGLQSCAGRSLLRRRQWNDERQPHAPAVRPVLRGELVVALDVHVPLAIPRLEEVADLRADPHDPGLEVDEGRAGAAVPRDLLIDVAHEADVLVLRQELGGAPF